MSARGRTDRWDEKWIRRTFELARLGEGGASPNPMVGCVIARKGRLLAEGHHEKFGGPHAEIHALKGAPYPRDATLYVNLEPCSHWGKTPPCADAIARAGIRRVICAMKDPNPLVKGGGIEKLRRFGLKVSVGLLEAEARDLNRSFIRFITHKRPYVILKAAMSLDGKTATRGGDSRWITSKEARELSHRLRTRVDAILVGAETARKDNPSLTSHGWGRNPARVILSGSGKISSRAKVFDGAAPTWVFHAGKTPKRVRNADWVRILPENGRKTISIENVLSELGRRGVSRLLVEGGAQTLGAFADAGAADEAWFFIAPSLIGGTAAQGAVGGTGARDLRGALKFRRISAQAIGRDVFIEARK